MKVKEKRLKHACNECGSVAEKMDMADRKNKITKILLNTMYPTQETFEFAVNSFAISSLSLAEVESLAKTMTPEYQSASKDYQNRQMRRTGVY